MQVFVINLSLMQMNCECSYIPHKQCNKHKGWFGHPDMDKCYKFGEYKDEAENRPYQAKKEFF